MDYNLTKNISCVCIFAAVWLLLLFIVILMIHYCHIIKANSPVRHYRAKPLQMCYCCMLQLDSLGLKII